jgi:L-2,4-diaminobutyric acid acetyltransferase
MDPSEPALKQSDRLFPKVRFRTPRTDDAPEIWNLVRNSQPLDLNSTYAYLLLCHHFGETCVVAELPDEIVGFISAYRPPKTDDVVFVWQVAVKETMRRKGLAKAMLLKLLNREICDDVSFLEASVTPSNRASQTLFRSLASSLNTSCVEAPLFSQELFAHTAHEPEKLLRVGPIPPKYADHTIPEGEGNRGDLREARI